MRLTHSLSITRSTGTYAGAQPCRRRELDGQCRGIESAPSSATRGWSGVSRSGVSPRQRPLVFLGLLFGVLADLLDPVGGLQLAA